MYYINLRTSLLSDICKERKLYSLFVGPRTFQVCWNIIKCLNNYWYHFQFTFWEIPLFRQFYFESRVLANLLVFLHNDVLICTHYYYYYYLLIRVFDHQLTLMVFHWRLSVSKSPQVSRTLLSILAVFNNAVVWMVSTRSPTSKSSKPFNNPLVTVPKAPITIGMVVTFRFHSFSVL